MAEEEMGICNFKGLNCFSFPLSLFLLAIYFFLVYLKNGKTWLILEDEALFLFFCIR